MCTAGGWQQAGLFTPDGHDVTRDNIFREVVLLSSGFHISVQKPDVSIMVVSLKVMGISVLVFKFFLLSFFSRFY